jgi:hypothetical protein
MTPCERCGEDRCECVRCYFCGDFADFTELVECVTPTDRGNLYEFDERAWCDKCAEPHRRSA